MESTEETSQYDGRLQLSKADRLAVHRGYLWSPLHHRRSQRGRRHQLERFPKHSTSLSPEYSDFIQERGNHFSSGGEI